MRTYSKSARDNYICVVLKVAHIRTYACVCNAINLQLSTAA